MYVSAWIVPVLPGVRQKRTPKRHGDFRSPGVHRFGRVDW